MQKSGPTLAGALITGAEHSKSRELLCQEYTLKTDRVTYRIRPKEEKHPALLPVGEEAEFRLKKDQMLLRVPESDSKEREYIVVSMTPTSEFASAIESTRKPPKPHANVLKDDSGPEASVTSGPAQVAGASPSAHLAGASSAVAAATGSNGSSVASAAPSPLTASAGDADAKQSPGVPASSSGSLQVDSNPAGAEIYVDSAIAGRTPALLTLKTGSHSIQVVMSGYKDWVTNVKIAPGAQQQVSVDLSR